MATEDETIERVALNMDEPGPTHSASLCINATPEKRREIVRNVCSLLRPGDRPGPGLMVVRGKATVHVIKAGLKELDETSHLSFWTDRIRRIYEVMLAAQQEDR